MGRRPTGRTTQTIRIPKRYLNQVKGLIEILQNYEKQGETPELFLINQEQRQYYAMLQRFWEHHRQSHQTRENVFFVHNFPPR